MPSECTCPNVIYSYLPSCSVHGHISREGDVHTMPADGDHESSSKCWCMPRVIYVALNGSQQWLHGRPS